ncbi:site-specific integrase [bacterium]|nr:MAG: site-specific integrase [bacterium]
MPSVNLTAVFVEKVKPNGKRIDYFDDSLPGFSLRVSENGVKSWCVSYRFGGKWTRYTFGTFPILSLKDARQRAKDALHDVADGINPATRKKLERDADTFDYLAAEYLERYSKTHKRSWKEDERLIEKEFLPAFGKMRLEDITRRDVRALLERKATTAPVGANRMRAALHKMFNWGITKDIVEVNPVLKIEVPAKEKARDRVLSEAEIKVVWKTLDNMPCGDKTHRKYRSLSALILEMELVTAQRNGEIMGAAWSEIEGDWWTIPGERTKNGLAHRVPLTQPARRILEEARQLCADKPSEYVFPGPRGGHISNIQKAVMRICTVTGIKFGSHDLRRTAATQMTSNGIPRITVKRILNHIEKDVTGIYDRYSYDREKREALEAWRRRLMLIVSDLKDVKSEA